MSEPSAVFREIKHNFWADDVAHRRRFRHWAADLVLFKQRFPAETHHVCPVYPAYAELPPLDYGPA